VSTDPTQARLQRMEKDVASIDDKVGILLTLGDEPAKQRIVDTFGDDPSMIVIYQGVKQHLPQTEIAKALRDRKLKGAQQARVSQACAVLEEKGFVKTAIHGYTVADGWDHFGIDKTLKQMLRRNKVEPLE
jgi:hypothetical protein